MGNEIPAPLKNVIESFNADIAEAERDGLTDADKSALMGAIVESILATMSHSSRRAAYMTMRYGIERRFHEGIL